MLALLSAVYPRPADVAVQGDGYRHGEEAGREGSHRRYHAEALYQKAREEGAERLEAESDQAHAAVDPPLQLVGYERGAVAEDGHVGDGHDHEDGGGNRPQDEDVWGQGVQRVEEGLQPGAPDNYLPEREAPLHPAPGQRA